MFAQLTSDKVLSSSCYQEVQLSYVEWPCISESAVEQCKMHIIRLWKVPVPWPWNPG